MNIGSIVNGVVIDHIPTGMGMALYRYLKLDAMDCEVAIIRNARSQKYGSKDILKVSDSFDFDYAVLGYIDPSITVNIIEDGRLVRKVHPVLPETITNVISCKNPRCITSIERELPQVFRLADRENKVYRCIYCDAKAEEELS